MGKPVLNNIGFFSKLAACHLKQAKKIRNLSYIKIVLLFLKWEWPILKQATRFKRGKNLYQGIAYSLSPLHTTTAQPLAN